MITKSENSDEIKKALFLVGWLDADDKVKEFWNTFETNYRQIPDCLLRLLNELAKRLATISDLYNSCKYSGSTSIYYNFDCLDFLISGNKGRPPASCGVEQWSLLDDIIYRDQNGKLVSHRLEKKSTAEDITSRFLKHEEAVVFDESFFVTGDRAFLAQVLSALTLLQSKASEDYEFVRKYLGQIRRWPESGIVLYVLPPTFLMSDKVCLVSITWCACSIAHEAYHSKLYQDYIESHPYEYVPKEVHSGKEIEVECINYQLKVAEKIGSPSGEIEHLKSCDGFHYNLPWGDPARPY